jgi:hypothetical protein
VVRKDKALALLLVVMLAGGVASGCSSGFGNEPNPHLVSTDDGGEEEVLDPNGHDDEPLANGDDASFGENEEEEGGTKTATGVLTSVLYLTATLASAVLPLLAFM